MAPFLTELLLEQRSSALQLLAAMVLTDQEAAEIILEQDPSARPENIQGWATAMREEMLSPAYRGKVVDLFRRFGLMANTHPGFPLGSFEAPPDVLALQTAYNDLVALSKRYQEGNAPGIGSLDNLDAYLSDFLAGEGHTPEVVQFVLVREKVKFLMAGIERLSKGLSI